MDIYLQFQGTNRYHGGWFSIPLFTNSLYPTPSIILIIHTIISYPISYHFIPLHLIISYYISLLPLYKPSYPLLCHDISLRRLRPQEAFAQGRRADHMVRLPQAGEHSAQFAGEEPQFWMDLNGLLDVLIETYMMFSGVDILFFAWP